MRKDQRVGSIDCAEFERFYHLIVSCAAPRLKVFFSYTYKVYD